MDQEKGVSPDRVEERRQVETDTSLEVEKLQLEAVGRADLDTVLDQGSDRKRQEPGHMRAAVQDSQELLPVQGNMLVAGCRCRCWVVRCKVVGKRCQSATF